MTVNACTIIARNYLPAARVLAASFFEHHPDGRFATLVVDDVYGLVDPDAESFDVLFLSDLPLDAHEARRMAAIYNVTELSTAVKPWLLRALLDRGQDPVLYLDPDVKVFSPLDDLVRQAADKGIVLTPHVTAPMPRDGKSASESDILGSGVYNLGFIGISSSVGAMLEFWMERLARECRVRPKEMRFTDQRWVDFVPGIWDVAIDRNPRWDVAYWNLDHRRLDLGEKGYEVNGEPLGFFHFSGFDPRTPWLLSKHQGARPRILLSQHPDLKSLCDEYGADLFAARRSEDGPSEYGYSRLANGLAFDDVMRTLYREALVTAEQSDGELPPNPLEPGADDEFVAWLNDRQPSGPPLSRYLGATYDARPDLQEAFPGVAEGEMHRFNEWIRHEVAERRLDVRLAVEAPEDGPGGGAAGGGGDAAQDPAALQPGIRIAGYFRAETGVGEHARLAVAAARQAGITVATAVDTTSVGRQSHDWSAGGPDNLDVNLICVNADQIESFARRAGEEIFAGRYNIGLWAWELEQFPTRFASSFQWVDEVWANSSFSHDAIARLAESVGIVLPIEAFPLPVAEPQPAPGFDRSRLGIPDGYCFLFCFDLMSVMERKNPLGLIEAFSLAFAPGEGPTLVIKVVNTEERIADAERLRFAAAERSDVVLVETYLDAAENAGLMASCDCYVSLHRSEGFGLTLAEAMALGKPVIATGYSGNLDFMTPEVSYLVPYTPGEVPIGAEPYPRAARWAEPDLEEAARLMRHVHDHRGEAAEVGSRAREHVLANHGIAARARFIAERFQAARAALADPKRRARRAGFDPDAGAPPLIALAQQRPNLDAPSNYPRLARRARELVERTLRNHDEYQREMNLKLAMGVEHIARLLNEVQLENRSLGEAIRSAPAERMAEVKAVKEIVAAQGERLRALDSRLRSLEVRTRDQLTDRRAEP